MSMAERSSTVERNTKASLLSSRGSIARPTKISTSLPLNGEDNGDFLDFSPGSWIKDIRETSLYKRKCRCFLIFLLETDPSFSGVTYLINQAMACGKRRAVRIINEDRIQQAVLDHCFKTKERTPFSALCEEIRLAAGPRFNNKIPNSLLAYMIKYLILQEQDNFVEQKDYEEKLKFRAKTRYIEMALKHDLKIELTEEPKNDQSGGKDGAKKKEAAQAKKPSTKGKGVKEDVATTKTKIIDRFHWTESEKEIEKESDNDDTPLTDSEVDTLIDNLEGYRDKRIEMLKMDKFKRIPRKTLKGFMKPCADYFKKNKKWAEENDDYIYSQSEEEDEEEDGESDVDESDDADDDTDIDGHYDDEDTDYNDENSNSLEDNDSETISVFDDVPYDYELEDDYDDYYDTDSDESDVSPFYDSDEYAYIARRGRSNEEYDDEKVQGKILKTKEDIGTKDKHADNDNKKPIIRHQNNGEDSYNEVEDEYEFDKIDTLLNKRGQRVRDICTIDDSPLNGPDLYIFISSFSEIDLIPMMRKLGIILDAYLFVGYDMLETPPSVKDSQGRVIGSCAENDKEFSEYMNKNGWYLTFLSASTFTSRAKKKQLVPLEHYKNTKSKLKQFYEVFFRWVGGKKTYIYFENIMMARYIPEVDGVDFDSEKWMNSLSDMMYDNVSKIGYHYYRIKSIYCKYIMNIPKVDLKRTQSLTAHKLRFYYGVLDEIPNEIVSVPLILDTLLAQVCVNSADLIGYELSEYEKNLCVNDEPIAEDIDDVEQAIKTLHSKHMPTKEQRGTKAKCMLVGDELSLFTEPLGGLGRLVRDRTQYIIELYFDNLLSRLIPPVETTDLLLNQRHYKMLLKSCATISEAADHEPLVNILTSIAAIGMKLIENTSSDETFSIKSSRTVKIEENLSSVKSSSQVTTFPNLMYALNKLEDIFEVAKTEQLSDTLKKSIMSFRSLQDVYYLPHKFIDEFKEKSESLIIKQLFFALKHFVELPRRIFLQKLWNNINECNYLEVDYIPLTDKTILNFYDRQRCTIEEGTIPCQMTLREFFKYGTQEMSDFYQEQTQVFVKEHTKNVFRSDIDKLKYEIIDPIEPVMITPKMAVLKRHFQFPEDIKDLIDEDYFRGKQPRNVQVKRGVFRSIMKPTQLVFDLDDTRRSILFTTTRNYLFPDSTNVTTKILAQIYHPPKLSLEIKQNGHCVIFHTVMCRTFEPQSILFTHSSGIRVNFFEILDETEQDVEESEEEDVMSIHGLSGYSRVFRVSEMENSSVSSFGDGRTMRSSESSMSDELMLQEEENEAEEPEQAVDKCNHDIELTRSDEDLIEFVKGVSKNIEVSVVKDLKLLEIPEVRDLDAKEDAKFKFNFSLPNGLFVETVSSAEDIAYIKQTYLIKNKKQLDELKNEYCRLLLNDGTVIKLKQTTQLEVMYACGRWVSYENFGSINAKRMSRKKTSQSNGEVTDEHQTDSLGSEVIEEEEQQEEEQEEEDAAPVLCVIIEPDGTKYRVKNGVTRRVTKLGCSECNDIFNETRSVQVQGGPSLCFTTSNVMIATFPDNTRIVTQSSFATEEVHCEWLPHELVRWFQYKWSRDDHTFYENYLSEATYIQEYLDEGLYSNEEEKLELEEKLREKQMKIYIKFLKEKPQAKPKLFRCKMDAKAAKKLTKRLKAEQKMAKKARNKNRIQNGNEAKTVRSKSGFIRYYKRINLSQDGFQLVNREFLIEHEEFASVSVAPNTRKQEFFLPHNVVIIDHGNGCFDLVADDDTLLRIRGEEFVLEKYIDEELHQRSIFEHELFKTILEESKYETIFQSVDKHHNWVTMDISGNVDYYFQQEIDSVSGQNALNTDECTKYLDNTTRRLIMNADYSGYEILVPKNIAKYREQLDLDKCQKYVSYEQLPFIRHAYSIPVDISSMKWNMACLNFEKPLFNLPSTYGKTWLFPFLIADVKICREMPMEIVLLQLEREFAYENMYTIFRNLIKEYLRLIEEDDDEGTSGTASEKQELEAVEEDKVSQEELVEAGQLVEPSVATMRKKFMGQCQDKVFLTDLQKEVSSVFKRLRRTCFINLDPKKSTIFIKKPPLYFDEAKLHFKFKKKYSEKYFKNKVHAIYHKLFAPYFETGRGVAYCMIQIILKRAYLLSDIVRVKKRALKLFDQPIEFLTDDDFQDIEYFFELLFLNTSQPKNIDFKRLLKAAKELSEYFPTLRHAFEFRIEYHGEKTIEMCEEEEMVEESRERPSPPEQQEDSFNTLCDQIEKGFSRFMKQAKEQQQQRESL